MGLEKLGLRDKSKGNEIVDLFCILIDWMPQSAVTLYIYRVGWTYPAINLVYISKSIKIPSCTRTLLGSVRPVKPTGQTGRSYQTGYRKTPTGQTAYGHRSDRSANFGRQHMPPCFLAKLACQRTLLYTKIV